MDVKKNILVISLLWLAVIVASLIWNYVGAVREQERLAHSTASSIFEQIVITRQWNARHGGLYAPVTPTTQPNPYLKIENRDIVIDESLSLTNINPAYMTRQIAEIAKESSGIQFHITSLNPIRPENGATPKETAYLQRFEKGARAAGEFYDQEGTSYYFYMAPLITDKTCLKCHAEQGYAEGDIRGGISVTLPFTFQIPLKIMVFSHLIIGLLGLLGLLLVGRTLNESYNTIKRQAVMDALTGIPNRRSFTQSVLREFNRSRRQNEPLSIIMVDIDNFKAFNDHYGHNAGDACLKQVARGIKASLRRPGDFCARYGGEEFVVILANTRLKGAIEVAERIRDSIERLAIDHAGSPPARVVTVSLGVATLDDATIQSHEQLIKHADEALYLAKDKGRNRVQCYRDGPRDCT